ncbi:MAG TPA: DUF4349 domain-containing protein [Solirubrobacteraceae bacterium]|nr:DUF4349 domain-containing protein [Solirubrobacteraceae bacterium]
MRDELAAIDATLAGGAVDPRHAELAELSVLLADLRPAPDAAAVTRMDTRAAAVRPREPVRLWRPRALGALAGAAAAVGAAVVVIGGAGGGGSAPPSMGTSSSPQLDARPAQTQASNPDLSAAPSAAGSAGAAPGTTGSAASAPSAAGSAASAPPILRSAPGRAVVQSAQLTLSASPNRIDTVSSEVFAVVGSAGGYVENSSVTQTGGTDGFAHFTLSLPSSALPTAMAELSRLRYSQVASRTDGSQDVTGTLDALRRQLGDARALRTSLLRQLASATTPAQLAGLRGQLHDASGLIARLTAQLGHLQRSVAYSAVTLTVQAGAPAPVAHHARSTLQRALHRAGRILSSIAGVAVLIAAVLLPLAAATVLCAWGWLRFRRRWRELALRE